MTVAASAPAIRSRETRRKPGSRRRRDNLAGYLFLSPWLLGFVFIIGGPWMLNQLLGYTADLWQSIPNYVG